jgi:hypothetical protein
MYLNEKDRQYLNDIYARAYKKYFAKTAHIGGKPLPYARALEIAREELETFYAVRIAEINAKHDERVLGINTRAAERGILTSTIVLHMIEKAEHDRTLALEKFETVTDAKVRAAARKIMAEQLGQTRLAVQVDIDAIKQTSASDPGKAMNEEVYAEYLRFLLKLDNEVAAAYINDDPLFGYNLSAEYFGKLENEIRKRV